MTRSFGLVVLGALAAVLGVLHAIDVLLYLGILASALTGGNSFYGFSILGAILTGIVAWIWFWAAGGLWQREAQAWRFVIFVAIFSLVFDVVAIIGGTPLAVRMPSIVLAALALILALLPSTREAVTPHAAA
jgi:hypothetical protein